MSWCNPGEGLYCSVASPNFGCTQNENEACFEIHLCNAPLGLLLSLAILMSLLVFLLCSGCCWCCCCCCCGRYYQNTCPCFTGSKHFSVFHVLHVCRLHYTKEQYKNTDRYSRLFCLTWASKFGLHNIERRSHFL